MFKGLIDKFAGKLFKDNKLNNKKLIEYLILIAVLGVVIIITANSLWGGGEESQPDDAGIYKQALDAQQTASDPNLKLEREIAQILSEIQGVGRVSVMLTYSSGPESIFARDTRLSQTDTKEKDSGGGERLVLEKEQEDKLVILEGQGGSREPIVLKQLTSKVKGVIVVADGADSIAVKTNIIRAVEVVTGVSGHRVQVFKRRQS